MPPATSAPSSNTHDSTETPPRPYYLSTLRQIDEFQVPDLASTLLTNPAEDEANEANVSFLRTPIDPQDEWRAHNAESAAESRQQHYQPQHQRDGDGRSRMSSDGRGYIADDRARWERLQRVLQRLNRLHDPGYGDRTPNHNRLYDWSPASEADDDDTELQEYMRDVRRQQPNTHPDVLRVLARSQMDADRERRERARQRLSESQHRTSGRPQPEREHRSAAESSLRSAAILQAVRRHPRFSARLREHGSRHVADRERYALDNEYLDRQSRQSGPTLPQIRPAEAVREYMRTRRPVLQDPNESSTWLQQTITYLSNLRNSTSYEDSLGYAVDAGFVTKEFFGVGHDDFLLNLQTLPTISETSLLAPGTVFKGHQHATSDSSQQHQSHTSHVPITTLWRPENRSSVVSASRLNSLPPLEDLYPHQDWFNSAYHPANEWPVRVTIHSIDYITMTLSATMVAYDVPSHPQNPPNTTVPLTRPSSSSNNNIRPLSSHAPASATNSSNAMNPSCSGHKSITTYLEGEILDFTRTSLLTEHFKATLANDATYWRKVEPFKDLGEEELVRKLVSHEWLSNLCQKYVLMRWKERCFVRTTNTGANSSSVAPHNSSSDPGGPVRARGTGAGMFDGDNDCEFSDGCGLTISGFYYVCLRRQDGEIEGLYCDPHSSPYQHLRLKREAKSAFPAWEFK